MPLAESIGGFAGDEFMIAVGDRAKIMFKVWLLAGPTLKLFFKSTAGQEVELSVGALVWFFNEKKYF